MESNSYNLQQTPNQPDRRHTVLGVLIVLFAVLCLLLSIGIGIGTALLLNRSSATEPETVSNVSTGKDDTVSVPSDTSSDAGISPAAHITYADDSTGKKQKTYAQVYAENVGSTVGITTSIQTNFFGYVTTSAASGSGFILTEDGYIVTNYHVIEGASSIKVTTYDDTVFDASLIGYDEANDIAILKIDATGLVPVTVGKSSALVVGDIVAAIGNPLGELTFSLTTGVVSAMDRSITMSSGITMKLIQTDCAINSGNSGGALFNLYGEVIGITNAKYSGSSSGSASIDNIGFAIPIDSVLPLITEILETGHITQPYIGVNVGSVSTNAQFFGYPKGAYVQSVDADSPAEKAGIAEGDIITAFNGNTLSGGPALCNYIASSKIGDAVTVTVYRSGKYIDLALTIGGKQQVLSPGGSQSQYSST